MSNVSSSNGLEKYPKLRFKGFSDPWTVMKLSDFTMRIMRKNTANVTDIPLTISSKDGLINQNDFFNKQVASKDMSGYYLLHHGEYAYNKSYSVGYDFGSIKRLEKYDMGALSTLYICFALTKFNSDFIKHYFDSLKWYREIYMISAEGARNHGLLNVPTEEFFATLHTLPTDEAEQEKIASFLDALIGRIEKQRSLVENLKKYKRGVIYELFVNPDSQFDVEMAAIPMSQLLTEYRNRNTEGLRVCSVAVSRGVVDQIEHLGRSFAASDTSHYGRVKFGDVVYTKSPTGDFPFGIVKQSKLNEEVAVSPLYGVYTPASYATGNLIHAYFEQYQYANNYICTLAQKGAKNTINITNQRFLEKCIRFPVKESDREYFSALLDMLTEKAIKAEKMLEYLLAQKRTLLAKMFI